jgi:putative isomerase
MKNQKKKNALIFLCLPLLIFSCNNVQNKKDTTPVFLPSNILNYNGTPSSLEDRSSLAFSDQGAWFAYGFSSEENKKIGFSGPFLMTQGHGEWSSKILSELELNNRVTKEKIDLNTFSLLQTSFNSHLNQILESQQLKIEQNLFFNSPHSAIISIQITNISKEQTSIEAKWKGLLFSTGLQITKEENTIILSTDRSKAKGIIKTFGDGINEIKTTDSSYSITLNKIEIKSKETKTLVIAQTFIFPEYDNYKEQQELELAAKNPLKNLKKRIKEKEAELSSLNDKLDTHWKDKAYKNLVAKTVLTLQNNTRIPVGELKHAGIFPSYHYKWFLGFWAWDSWKHAVAVANYNTELAKDQIRAMYDFQLDNGFIVDCIYRDTTIERHNYRNTKPPLSAWAVWKVYEKDGNIDFIKEIYPKIVNQHKWWYKFRDYDNDGICEYGSTDGTLIAAKWESGMDNAVRFDKSQLLKSAQAVFSLNQESVDLNAYLYSEKIYLIEMAKVLKKVKDIDTFKTQAEDLKIKIQNQFYDEKTGWFYDTSIDGENFIAVMGCEGWIPLWAKVATNKQAHAVKTNMINPSFFNTKVPFQTLSASHPSFNPNGGYWRGPNWLDQAYFGVKGLHNYGYHQDAYKATHKLIQNAKGVLGKGTSIRENYQPISGEGLESENFSWSAAHYLLLLLNE